MINIAHLVAILSIFFAVYPKSVHHRVILVLVGLMGWLYSLFKAYMDESTQEKLLVAYLIVSSLAYLYLAFAFWKVKSCSQQELRDKHTPKQG